MSDVAVQPASGGRKPRARPSGRASRARSRPAQAVTAADLEDFFENGALALHLVGADGRILRANKAELDLLGYSANEYLGRHVADFHVDPAAIEDILARLRRGERVERYPARLRAKDGSIKLVEITSSGQLRKGKLVNSRCFTVDVTALRRAEEQVAEKQRELEQVLEALPAAVYTTDAQGKITYFNRAAVELAGRTPAIGVDEWCVTFRLRLPDGTPLPLEECPMAVALKENRPVRGVEALAVRPDGSLIPFLPFPTPLRNSKGEMIGAVNMLVDISERKSAEAQQRLLLAELNHRVKNNLQMLYSLLLNAQRSAGGAEARSVLKEAAQRVAAMAAAQQLLYGGVNPHSIAAADFLQTVCDAARLSFDKATEIVIRPAAGSLSNDAAMPLALILNELLTNAVKHGVNGRGGGAITVQMTRDGDACCLRVDDDGPGYDLKDALQRASGLKLIVGLARQLRGTFELLPGPGARCAVTFNDFAPAR